MSGGDIIALVELSRCNTAWLASRVATLEQQLAAIQADNAELRKCVELYADSDNWLYSDSQCHLDLWGKTDHGYEPAKKCLEELRG